MPSVGAEGAQIYYEVHGEGRPVVLLASLGTNCLAWYQQVPFFASRYSVITIDSRGTGRSVCDADAMSLQYGADDLMAVLDAEEIGAASIVTHGSGGFGAMRLALERPERVCCLVLCNSTGGIVTPQVQRSISGVTAEYQREGPRATQGLSPRFVAEQPAASFLLMQLFGLNPPFDPGLVAEWFEQRLHSEELTGFATPTLIIAGEEDRLTSIEGLRDAATAIPGSKFVEFPGAGLVFYERPREFNRIAAEFIDQNAGM